MKNLVISILALLLAVFAYPLKGMAGEPGEKPLVCIIDLEDEVGPTMWRHVHRNLDKAKEMGASMVVIRVNTYGGEVVAADSIRTALLRMPVPTVAFVDPNAASAGALITLACDSVWMAPGASYGASSVVNGAGEVMPDKYQSYMRSIMRATAESHGKVWNADDSAWVWRRDPAIAESMVTPEKVTTLTPDEAVSKGYAEGKAHNIEEVITHYFEPGSYHTEKLEPANSDAIIGFLASAGVRAVLIMLILGGIYFEMQTPGIGFAGGVAFVAAVLYFVPTVVAGSVASWVVILFLIGLILLALEMFVIPGFGICGIAGIVCVLASLVGAMLGGGLVENGYAVDLIHASVITVVGVLLAVALVWFMTSRYGPKWVRRSSELQTELHDSEGYVGVDMSQGQYVGSHGYAITDLRPSGKVDIDGREFDAVSLSGFVDAHTRVKAVKFENAQLYVRKSE